MPQIGEASVKQAFANSNTQLDAPEIWRTSNAQNEIRRVTIGTRPCCTK
jgi:hypothetical protein